MHGNFGGSWWSPLLSPFVPSLSGPNLLFGSQLLPEGLLKAVPTQMGILSVLLWVFKLL